MSDHGHDHKHGMAIPDDWTGPFDQAFWDARYSERQQIWSGNANPHLVRTVAALDPGVALDIGSGEGGDAIWLAEQGWRVTATDLSVVALERGAALAAERAADAAPRIEWRQADVLSWAPEAGAYDLVTSQYSHFPSEQMDPLVRRLAAAVAVGGTLHIVGHEAHDHSPMGPEYFYTGEHLASLLITGDGSDVSAPAWEIVEAGLAAHPTREGSDSVLTARRLR